MVGTTLKNDKEGNVRVFFSSTQLPGASEGYELTSVDPWNMKSW